MAALVPDHLLQQIRAYLYVQYNDDQDLQSWFKTYNLFAQSYLDSVNALNLPDYTGPLIVGALLDWVAEGLYGLKRPVLPSGQAIVIGPLNTWALNELALNDSYISGSSDFFETTDDIFKRIITWHVYKGDGRYFSIPWLKRRVQRFLIGAAGTAPEIEETYGVGVEISVGAAGVITLIDADPTLGPIFQAAVQGGVLALPFQLQWSVDLA